jgi:Xaa-Pro aminopeptidase
VQERYARREAYEGPLLGVEDAARWYGIGVRLEDNLVITATGNRNLRGQLPRRPEAVAAIVREGLKGRR